MAATTITNIYCSEDELKQEILKLQKDPTLKKTKFGEMVLKIVTKLLTKTNFSGYSTSWKNDMISNAIEKIMLYSIYNYDENKISKINNEKVKAFAYITQIANNAFIEVINKRKQDQNITFELLKYEDGYSIMRYKNLAENSNINKKQSNNNTFKKIYDFEILISPLLYNKNKNIHYIMSGSNKNKDIINIYDIELLGDYIIYDMIENKVIKFIESVTEFKIYNIIESNKDIINSKKSKIIYNDYNLTFVEYEKIKDLNLDNINIHKYENLYIPSFPKKEKKKKENHFDIW